MATWLRMAILTSNKLSGTRSGIKVKSNLDQAWFWSNADQSLTSQKYMKIISP